MDPCATVGRKRKRHQRNLYQLRHLKHNLNMLKGILGGVEQETAFGREEIEKAEKVMEEFEQAAENVEVARKNVKEEHKERNRYLWASEEEVTLATSQVYMATVAAQKAAEVLKEVKNRAAHAVEEVEQITGQLEKGTASLQNAAKNFEQASK